MLTNSAWCRVDDAQRSHSEEGRGAVKPGELPLGHRGGQSLVSEVGKVLTAHPWHFGQAFKLPYDLAVNMIQFGPDFSGQAAVYRWDFFRVRVPAVVQPALDCLIGFYLIAKELYSGLAMPAGVQSAGHGLKDLMLADRVIDELATRVLVGRDIPGEEKTLYGQFE